MANWRHYMNNDYAGCRLLAYAHDYCRNRDVRIYVIPGVADAVGISDGTDRWIAPVRADVFNVNVERLMADLHAGKEIPKPVPRVRQGRVALLPDDEPPAVGRRPRATLIDEEQPRKGRSREILA